MLLDKFQNILKRYILLSLLANGELEKFSRLYQRHRIYGGLLQNREKKTRRKMDKGYSKPFAEMKVQIASKTKGC
jgi:hypothetical protein